jgi:hypothetical protein
MTCLHYSTERRLQGCHLADRLRDVVEGQKRVIKLLQLLGAARSSPLVAT